MAKLPASHKELIVYQKADWLDNKTIVDFAQRNTELIKMLTTMMKNLEDKK